MNKRRKTSRKAYLNFLYEEDLKIFAGERILEVQNLNKRFGGVFAINNVSFHVNRGEILGLIGPNGAGKTTMINLISGLLRRDNGVIRFKNKEISHLPAHRICERGIGRTFQIVQTFQKMTVEDNLIVPCLARLKEKIKMIEQIEKMLIFLNLFNLKDEFAGNLSGGQQKLLEFGRTLMLNSELFLLDEPFVGVHPKIRKQIYELIELLNSMGKTFLVISHDMKSIFQLCHRIIVLSSGKKIAEGNPADIKSNDEVLEAYLGD